MIDILAFFMFSIINAISIFHEIQNALQRDIYLFLHGRSSFSYIPATFNHDDGNLN